MVFRRVPAPLRLRVRRKVRVHMIGMTESLDGVLVGRTRHDVILRAAAIVHENGDSHQLSGEQLVPRERIAFIQSLL
jgi:hypothetical protein